MHLRKTSRFMLRGESRTWIFPTAGQLPLVYIHRCVWKLYDWVHYQCSNNCPPVTTTQDISSTSGANKCGCDSQPVPKLFVALCYEVMIFNIFCCFGRLCSFGGKWNACSSKGQNICWLKILSFQRYIADSLSLSLSLWIWLNHQTLSEVATSSNNKIFPKSRL